MTSLKTTVTGYAGYRGHEGQISFLLHRFTGLGTLLFLIIHILDTATVYFIPSLYEEAIAIYRSTLFGIGEIILVFCLIYHGVNGLRIAYLDMLAPHRWEITAQKKSVWWTLGISLVLWLPATVVMLRNLLIHNFGMFGG